MRTCLDSSLHRDHTGHTTRGHSHCLGVLQPQTILIKLAPVQLPPSPPAASVQALLVCSNLLWHHEPNCAAAWSAARVRAISREGALVSTPQAQAAAQMPRGTLRRRRSRARPPAGWPAPSTAQRAQHAKHACMHAYCRAVATCMSCLAAWQDKRSCPHACERRRKGQCCTRELAKEGPR